VPDELLLTLPFAALVTRAEGEAFRTLAARHAEQQSPSSDELPRHAQLAWLVNDHAVTVLPSATSLRALRRGPRPRARDVEPLIAFGDPVLLGGRGLRGGAMIASRGPSVSLDDLRRLDRLPGTRDELLAVAAALGADPARALYLDTRATKPTVRQLNASGRLGRARVVSFATHGLMAGDLTGLTQPALVLTPPARPSDEDDGLLGLEDVMELRLTDTDWIVLSACNTASGDGSGESLAGLARAFFFAGAPSLLVSYWSVEDRATQALMTEVFRRYARDPTLSRAEALTRGMRAVMESGRGARAYLAHPFAWAAFFLLGEGG
jgi:CHAT domain-containing protein